MSGRQPTYALVWVAVTAPGCGGMFNDTADPDRVACYAYLSEYADCLEAAGDDLSKADDAVCDAYPGEDRYFQCLTDLYSQTDCTQDNVLHEVLQQTPDCEQYLK